MKIRAIPFLVPVLFLGVASTSFAQKSMSLDSALVKPEVNLDRLLNCTIVCEKGSVPLQASGCPSIAAQDGICGGYGKGNSKGCSCRK